MNSKWLAYSMASGRSKGKRLVPLWLTLMLTMALPYLLTSAFLIYLTLNNLSQNAQRLSETQNLYSQVNTIEPLYLKVDDLTKSMIIQPSELKRFVDQTP